MSRRRLLAACAALALLIGLLAGCASTPSGGTKSSGSTHASASVAATASVATSSSATPIRVEIGTDRGTVKLELYPAVAPVTVANFVKLTRQHFYDRLRVHRVVPGFVMQAGDPLTRGMTAKAVRQVVSRRDAGTSLTTDPAIGTGGPGWTIPLEQTGLVHDRGVIAMARSQAPDSAGSQFYITLAAAHSLDGQYAVFGKVTEGMGVVDALNVGDEIRFVRIVSE